MKVRACLGAFLLIVPVSLLAQQTIQLPARDVVLSTKPTVIYSIGKEDGEDWEVLSGVIATAFDARDNLYVLDSNNYRVLVFDAAGKFARKISKRGEGPGELMAPTGVTVMSDGTVVVSDGGRHAFALFKSDGTFVKHVPFEDMEGVGGRTAFPATADFWLDGLHAYPSGGIVAQFFSRRARMAEAATGPRKVRVKRLDLSAPNAAAHVLYELTLPSVTPKVTESSRGTSVTTQPPYWTPGNSIGVLPNGGIAVAHEADYRVKLVNAAGKVERIIERPIRPRKGTTSDREAFVKRISETITENSRMMSRSGAGASTPVTRQMIDQMLKSATWLDVIPVLRRLTADPQGRIWVARTPDKFAASGPVDLVRTDGHYIGTIANAQLPAAVSKTGRAAFIEVDEFGVEHVSVKRLPADW